MKRLFALIPCLSFGLDSYLLGLQESLKTQTQTNLSLIRSLFRDDDKDTYLTPAFSYSKESLYTAYRGDFSLYSKINDDGTLIPFIHYAYTDLKDSFTPLTSHSISAGLKARLDSDFLELFSGLSVGGDFAKISNSNLEKYSLLFADAQLGVGERFDFFNDRFEFTPIIYLDYSYLYQKSSQHFDKQSHHSLSMLLGAEFDLGLIKGDNYSFSLSCFGFYRHLFLGEKLTNQQIQYLRAQDLGYAGIGLNLDFENFLFALNVDTEFAKSTYTLQTLARIGVEF